MHLLRRLRLRLSHLNEHRFNHNFQNCINSLCTCRLEVESISHFFLHCLHYNGIRATPLNKFKSVDENILKLFNLLLYGDLQFDSNKNSRLNATIKYIIDSGRFTILFLLSSIGMSLSPFYFALLLLLLLLLLLSLLLLLLLFSKHDWIIYYSFQSSFDLLYLGVISIFLRAIVLQTDSPNGLIDNTTFCVDNPTKPILAVFSPTNHWSYSPVGLSIRWSWPVYQPSVSQVLLFAGQSIH